MYHRTLKVALVGLPADAVRAIRAAETPPRFTVEFTEVATVDKSLAEACAVVIVRTDALGDLGLAELSAATHDGVAGFSELVVAAASDELAVWTADDYAAVDAVWPADLSYERAAFEFANLLGRAHLQAERYLAGAQLDTIIDSMPAMVWFKAMDGEHVKVNSYFCDIVDKTRDDVEGQFHNYIWNVPPEDWENAELTCKESDDKAIQAGVTVRCDENVSTHGEIRLFDTYKTPVFDEDGTVLGTSGFAHDITLERELQQLAWLNARTDYLTGLYNRRYFYEYLEEHAHNLPLTFVLIDLDNFKSINDGSGHDEGDNALLVTTAALHKCFPDCPVVRWGGDEFIVVVPHETAELADDENMNAFQSILQEWTAEKCPIMLTASIGIAQHTDDIGVDQAVRNADDSLYEAKRAGKARHIRFGSN